MARGLRRVLGGDRSLSGAVSPGALVRPRLAGDASATWFAKRQRTDQRLRAALAAALLVAAGVHTAIGLDHGSTNFGSLAMASAAVQFGLAAAIMLRRSGQACRLAVMVSLVLVELYVVNVTTGLPPLVAHSHSGTTHQIFGLILASPAPVDGEGILAKGAELGAILTGVLLGRSG